jgi:hypothetical protein
MLFKDKKKLRVALRIIVLVLILGAVDQFMGRAIEKIFYMQGSGKYARITKAIDHSTADIFIFGSSHAHRHYDPSIISSITGAECYNVGTKGQGILFHLAVQEAIFNRHVPEITILNIDPKILYENKKLYDRLADLLPYYRKHKSLDRHLTLRGPFEKYKLKSGLYPYNSTLAHILYFHLVPQNDVFGHRPLIGNIKPRKFKNVALEERDQNQNKIASRTAELPLDENFINAFNAFIDNCRKYGSRLILIASPNYSGDPYTNDISFNQIRAIINEKNIEFYNFSGHNVFKLNEAYFHDLQHMNKQGARLFSKIIAERIQSSL